MYNNFLQKIYNNSNKYINIYIYIFLKIYNNSNKKMYIICLKK